MTLKESSGLQIKPDLSGLADLINTQRAFQIRLGNSVPEINKAKFEHIQTSILHNVYQAIEFQEFLEATTDDDRKEELVDYLLFLLNKYIYLGLDYTIFTQSIIGSLYSSNMRKMSSGVAVSIANMEQNDYLTLLRFDCIFKPWKAKKDDICAKPIMVYDYFKTAMDYFRHLANMTYDNEEDFLYYLERKININIERQNNNY